MFCVNDLISIFNRCFEASHNTVLVCGDDEPIYLPASETRPQHTIMFAHGYFSSALHECAHWLIAGEKRRQLEDYGYWYVPDGRTAKQQAEFQAVEVKPQAMEWILSKAAGFPFQFSLDNLSGETIETESFKQAVQRQVCLYQNQGLPARAKRLCEALTKFYDSTVLT